MQVVVEHHDGCEELPVILMRVAVQQRDVYINAGPIGKRWHRIGSAAD